MQATVNRPAFLSMSSHFRLTSSDGTRNPPACFPLPASVAYHLQVDPPLQQVPGQAGKPALTLPLEREARHLAQDDALAVASHLFGDTLGTDIDMGGVRTNEVADRLRRVVDSDRPLAAQLVASIHIGDHVRITAAAQEHVEECRRVDATSARA